MTLKVSASRSVSVAVESVSCVQPASNVSPAMAKPVGGGASAVRTALAQLLRRHRQMEDASRGGRPC